GGFRKSCCACTMQNCANDPYGVSYPQIFWFSHASGSPPLHSPHSPHDWLQCSTTSSPTFHLVTALPTFHTTPEASDPAMWMSFLCPSRTLTALPVPAHTPL